MRIFIQILSILLAYYAFRLAYQAEFFCFFVYGLALLFAKSLDTNEENDINNCGGPGYGY